MLIFTIITRVISTPFVFVSALIAGLGSMLYTIGYATVMAALNGTIDAAEQRSIERKAFKSFWGLLKRIPGLTVENQ
jgi:hypothetical protein